MTLDARDSEPRPEKLQAPAESAGGVEDLRAEIRDLSERLDAMSHGRTPNLIPDHFRRYVPFYAIALAFMLIVVILPTTTTPPQEAGQLTGGDFTQDGGGLQGSAPLDTGSPSGPASPGTAPATAGQAPGGSGGTTPATTGDQPVAAPQPGAGVTRAGFDCTPGTRQIPWSSYAAPCVNAFDGANGGSTYRGVTDDTIRIAVRQTGDSADSAAVAAFAADAGAASADVAVQVRDTFRDYFNDVFELYGRRVEWVTYQASPQTNPTLEVQGRGKEGACIDATRVAQEVQAFAVQGASGPYGECLAERGVMSFGAGAYFPETWYRQHHPYLWNTTMDCERISYQVAEYTAKRLAPYPARYAKSANLKDQPRTFGVYVPNNREYQHCVNIIEQELQASHGLEIDSRYNYTLDVSRFPDEAARAVLQFKAENVTTIVNACDPISTGFLTQAATAQNYYPEWFIIGVVAQDADSVARLFEPEQTRGSLFGMSQISDQANIWGPQGEPGRTYQQITGQQIPPGTDGGYYGLLHLFNALQAAGPNLTPEHVAAGLRGLPRAGAPDFAMGQWYFGENPDGTPGGDHTAVVDSREVYWCATCASRIDGRAGAYIETYGGRRFSNGEWPAEEPQLFG